MPKNAKRNPPAAAKTARTIKAARQARTAARRRLAGSPPVNETKIGAAEIGLITENREEKARIPKLCTPAGIAGNYQRRDGGGQNRRPGSQEPPAPRPHALTAGGRGGGRRG